MWFFYMLDWLGACALMWNWKLVNGGMIAPLQPTCSMCRPSGVHVVPPHASTSARVLSPQLSAEPGEEQWQLYKSACTDDRMMHLPTPAQLHQLLLLLLLLCTCAAAPEAVAA